MGRSWYLNNHIWYEKMDKCCYQNFCKRLQHWFSTNSIGLYCGSMLHKLVSFFTKYFHEHKVKQGPNSLEELLNQFDLPSKQKTPQQNIQHHIILQKMIKLEGEYQHGLPEELYQGVYIVEYPNKVKIVSIPCMIRPGTLYDCFSRN